MRAPNNSNPNNGFRAPSLVAAGWHALHISGVCWPILFIQIYRKILPQSALLLICRHWRSQYIYKESRLGSAGGTTDSSDPTFLCTNRCPFFRWPVLMGLTLCWNLPRTWHTKRVVPPQSHITPSQNTGTMNWFTMDSQGLLLIAGQEPVTVVTIVQDNAASFARPPVVVSPRKPTTTTHGERPSICRWQSIPKQSASGPVDRPPTLTRRQPSVGKKSELSPTRPCLCAEFHQIQKSPRT